MKPVIVVGSFNVEHVWRCETLPTSGTCVAGRYSTGPGGKGFNQAIASARAGASTLLVCALGNDPGGAMARAMAAQDGLEILAQASDEPTGTSGIYVDGRGRDTIVIGAGANAVLDAGFVGGLGPRIAQAAVLLAQLETPVDTIQAALAIAHTAGVTTLLSTAPANAATTIGMLRLADTLAPNEAEFTALLARHVGERMSTDDVAALDGTSFHGLCRKLLPHGTVVVTLGSAGCFVSHAEDAMRGDAQAHYRVAAEPVQAPDTAGVQDAFNGALAASLATAPDTPFAAHVRFASRFSALSCAHPGTMPSMPRRAEVEARFPS